MIKDWSVDKIKNEISKISYAERDAFETGFITWSCKQDLYEIMWHVEEALGKCGTYAGEEEFLKEHDKKVMWKALKE